MKNSTTTNSANTSIKSVSNNSTRRIKRFYRVDKSLMLVEGADVAAMFAHLVDTYEYFEGQGQLIEGGIFYQASATITQFTGFKKKKVTTLTDKLRALGFIHSEVATIPGSVRKTTYYAIDFDAYDAWVAEHDYNTIRKAKQEEFFTNQYNAPDTKKPSLDTLKSFFTRRKEAKATITTEERVKPTLVKKEVVVTETPDEVENFDDMEYTEMVPYVLNYINLCKGTNNKASKLDTERIIEGLEYYGGWSSTGDMNDGLQVQIDARMERTSTQGTSYYVVNNENKKQ